MKRSIVADSIAYFFVLLFLYTGIAKLMDMATFRNELSSSPGLGALSGIITWALPIGEILLAVILFLPRWRLRGLYATLVLMTLFTGYVITLFLIDDQLSCSCGGIIEALNPQQHIVFNSTCVILSLVAIIAGRKQQPTASFRWMTNTSAVALFAIVGWILFAAFRAPAIDKTGMEGRSLPSFNLLMADSTTRLNTTDIPTGKSFLLVGFLPFCKHCQALMADLIQHIDEFRGTRIYYVTPGKFSDMCTFYRYYHLEKYPNIVVGWDSTNTFFSYFKAPGTPYTTVFDSRKRLKWVMTHETNAARLSQLLEE